MIILFISKYNIYKNIIYIQYNIYIYIFIRYIKLSRRNQDLVRNFSKLRDHLCTANAEF